MTPKTVRALAVLVLVGCAAPSEEVVSLSAPIAGGTRGGDPAVVVIQNYESGGLCSGSLIDPRVVLTAKHCVQEAFASGPARASSMTVGFGDSVRSTTLSARVQTIHTTPGVYTEDSQGSVNGSLVGSDVALMVLQSGVTGIEPIPVMRSSHLELSGQTITACGFGQTPGGGAGVKYVTTGVIQGVQTNNFFVGPITCQGDSGGPAITSAHEAAGVVSYGAGACGSGYGAYQALTNYLDLVDEALTEAGSCLNDGAERCDGADNDCNDLVDETCTPLGGSCTDDSECVGGLTCQATPSGSVCTTQCDPLRPELGCGPGLYCAFATGCDGFCVPLAGERGTLPVNAECSRNEDCDSLLCVDPGDHSMRCHAPCRGDAGMCLAGEACVAAPGGCGACVDESVLVADRGLGESCTSDATCRSGMCFEDVGRSYCTNACPMGDPDCPDGFHCREAVCVAGPRGNLGDPCFSNGDCAPPTFCATRGEQQWCTQFCSDAPCAEGFGCVAAGGAMVCAPIKGLVGDPCTANDECISGICTIPGGATSGSCTRGCGSDVPCATGFECRRTANGIDAVCVRPGAAPVVSGGCAVGGRSSGQAVWLLIGLALVIAWRRRKAS